MAQLNFDANTVAPDAGGMDPIPADWYTAQIDESEMKPTKDGAGSYLQLRFSVLEGNFANRKVFARLNLRNASQQAQEIAYGELSAICHATGVMQLQDSQQLHGIPLKIKVKLRAASGDYDASNEIASFKHITDNVGTPAAGGQQAPVQQMQQPVQQQPVQQQPVQQQPQQTWQQPQQQAPVQQQQQAPVQQQQQQQAPVQQVQQPWQQPTQQQAPVEQQQQQAPVQQQQQQQQQQAPVTQAQQPAPAGEMPAWAQGSQ